MNFIFTFLCFNGHKKARSFVRPGFLQEGITSRYNHGRVVSSFFTASINGFLNAGILLPVQRAAKILFDAILSVLCCCVILNFSSP